MAKRGSRKLEEVIEEEEGEFHGTEQLEEQPEQAEPLTTDAVPPTLVESLMHVESQLSLLWPTAGLAKPAILAAQAQVKYAIEVATRQQG